MGNVVAFIVTLLLGGGAIVYIVISKKHSKKCIGCPGECNPSKEIGCSACRYCHACDEKSK